MDRQRKILIAKCGAILSIIPVLIYAHAAGPPPRKDGGARGTQCPRAGERGESRCSEAGCHTGAGLNAGAGSVTIDAGGTTYAPGVKQRIMVTVSDPAQRKWGFQLTARLADNPKTRAGILAPINATTQ